MASAVVSKPATVTTTATSTPVALAIGWLTKIGAPLTQNNIDNYLRWGTVESGNPSNTQAYGGWNNFNPLNVVAYSGSGAIAQGGQQGDIANFGDVASGSAGSANLFLNNPNAAPIITAFRNDASTSTLNGAINQFYATWGGGPLDLSGATPDPTGQVGAQTDSLSSSLSGIDTFLLSPALGIASLFNGGKDPLSGVTALPAAILGIFSNWRYIAEVLGGVLMIILGIVLILHDTGTDKRIAQTAAVGAVAA